MLKNILNRLSKVSHQMQNEKDKTIYITSFLGRCISTVNDLRYKDSPQHSTFILLLIYYFI